MQEKNVAFIQLQNALEFLQIGLNPVAVVYNIIVF
jgi:hypothetical protein